MQSSTVLDWSNFTPPASWTQNGREYAGCCPVTIEGKTKAWALPDNNTIGCRLCGDGSGKLTGSAFREHAAALGILPEIRLGRAAPLDTWVWTTATGRRRKQFRWRCTCGGRTDCDNCGGRGTTKRWAKRRDATTPMPASLLYIPRPLDGAGTVHLVEGGSSADALIRHGLAAVAYCNAEPDRDSIERLPAGLQYVVWADHDPPGYSQAVRFADRLIGIGRTVRAVDPLLLRSDAPAKFDPRDWIPPAGADPGAAIGQAIVPLDSIRDRAPAPVRKKPDVPERELINQPDTAAGVAAALLACGYQHRYNVRSFKCEVRDTAAGDWKERDDLWSASVRRTIRDRCLTPVKKGDDVVEVALWYRKAEFFDVLDAHAEEHKVDPFVEWLEGLPAWDHEPRNWLACCFPSLAPNPLAEWASRMITVGAVRLAYKPGAPDSRMHEMPILQGGTQGTGKSAALAWLFPPERRGAWFTDNLTLTLPLKELVEGLQGRVLVEFSEMTGVNRTDAARLKQMLTSLDFGTVRLSFRRDPQSQPRRCVFTGTSNPRDCLPQDPTGHRRYVVLATAEVATDHIRYVEGYLDANRLQLWAEALHRFRDGEPHHLPDDLKRLQADANKVFASVDEATEIVEAALLGPDGELPSRVKWIDVRDAVARRCETAGARQPVPSDGRLTLALRHLGYVTTRDPRTRVRSWVRTPTDTLPIGGSNRSTFSTNAGENVANVEAASTPMGRVSEGVRTPAAPAQNEGATPPDRPPENPDLPPPAAPDLSEGSAHWQAEYDRLLASGVAPLCNDCVATCCRCGNGPRERCIITPRGPLCEPCHYGVPKGTRASELPGYALAVATTHSETVDAERRQSAVRSVRRLLAHEFDVLMAQQARTDYVNPYRDGGPPH